ncbi:MAG: restriction endonuclease subunit S, partial [Acidocella sp.]|nr:restriction endonuclease subunit S [Acidocella sp.]
MGDWVKCRLADLCSSIDYGYTASATTTQTGIKFLRITDIVGAGFNWNSVPYVSGDINQLNRYVLHDQDIVVARTGATTGESLYIVDPPEAVFASYLVRLKIKNSNDPRYISYWLKSPEFRNYLKGVLGDKSAQPNASASTMTNAPISLLTNRKHQTAVSSLLGTLDDKIELNRRMNETLEATARAIFKDWFV